MLDKARRMFKVDVEKLRTADSSRLFLDGSNHAARCAAKPAVSVFRFSVQVFFFFPRLYITYRRVFTTGMPLMCLTWSFITI